MSWASSLDLPLFYDYYKSPVKLVQDAEGELVIWGIDPKTGGWKHVDELVTNIVFAVGGEVFERTRQEFVQEVEGERAYYLKGEGPIFALYETVKAILENQQSENRPLSAEERALVQGIRRKTFRMFEEELQRQGDPGADPSLAD